MFKNIYVNFWQPWTLSTFLERLFFGWHLYPTIKVTFLAFVTDLLMVNEVGIQLAWNNRLKWLSAILARSLHAVLWHWLLRRRGKGTCFRQKFGPVPTKYDIFVIMPKNALKNCWWLCCYLCSNLDQLQIMAALSSAILNKVIKVWG